MPSGFKNKAGVDFDDIYQLSTSSTNSARYFLENYLSEEWEDETREVTIEALGDFKTSSGQSLLDRYKGIFNGTNTVSSNNTGMLISVFEREVEWEQGYGDIVTDRYVDMHFDQIFLQKGAYVPPVGSPPSFASPTSTTKTFTNIPAYRTTNQTAYFDKTASDNGASILEYQVVNSPTYVRVSDGNDCVVNSISASINSGGRITLTINIWGGAARNTYETGYVNLVLRARNSVGWSSNFTYKVNLNFRNTTSTNGGGFIER